MENIVQKLA